MKLFSPDDGHYEYSAVVTDNKNWDPKELLLFVSGRSAQENSISELKTSFAFDHIPTNTYQANLYVFKRLWTNQTRVPGQSQAFFFFFSKATLPLYRSMPVF